MIRNIKLSPLQRVIAWRLTEGRIVSTAELIIAFYGNDPHGGALLAEQVIRNRVCYLRHALAPYGIDIKAAWGVGFSVAEADIPRLRDILGDEIARNVKPLSKESLLFIRRVQPGYHKEAA